MMLFITALLFALVSAVDYRFSDIAVYGLDRCLAFGVGPSSYSMRIESPLRQSARDNNLAKAKVYITDSGNIRAEYSAGALVGLIRENELIFPENMQNNDDYLSRHGIEDSRICGARSGDTVIVFVPHTSSSKAIRVTRARFYKNFNKRDHGADNLPSLIERFMNIHFTSDRETRRFTLLLANVQRVDKAISRRFRLIHEPNDRFGSEDSTEYWSPSGSTSLGALSFQPQGQIPLNHVSLGGQSNPGFRGTQVVSAPLFGQQQPVGQNQQPLSFTSPPPTVFQGQPFGSQYQGQPPSRQGSRRK